eukprot:TRINITY_DN42431_c0_g1_i1.p1 TRINITY_DN42431_c0_g1~~TRINITY_DN42431_c0_g1_i1.p1  ORF type:complete len:274 (-),score=37.51 TRINITY_DN42431_c0_g1_i1:96-827(-)
MFCCCEDKQGTKAERGVIASSTRLAATTQRSLTAQYNATFDVTVDRTPSSYLGLNLSAAGKDCMVNWVAENSLIGEWNRSAKGDVQVKYGDRLLALDGVTAKRAKDVLDIVKDMSGTVTLKFQRPVLNIVMLQRSKNSTKDEKHGVKESDEQPLGLGLWEGPDFLLVLALGAGPAYEYNRSVSHEKRLTPYCRIVSINGEMGNGKKLREQLSNEATSEICLQVLSWPEPDEEEDPYCISDLKY